MEVINTIFGIPLGYILYFCYQFIGNYGLAIVAFTVLTKVILFPLSIVSQKNSIVMVKIQPHLEEIKQRFAGNNSLILQEQRALYKREHYSMVKSMLPLLIQIPIILGLINVIYNPMQHLLHIDPLVTEAMIAHAANFLQVPVVEMGYSAQLTVLELAHTDPGVFGGGNLANAAALEQMQSVDLNFLGVDLAMVPVMSLPTILYPILSGLSALALCLFQNKYNILQQNQGFLGKWGMAIFLVLFSAYFALVLPCGVGLYWILGNVLSIAVLALCNLIYDPRKFIDSSQIEIRPKLTREQRQAANRLKKQQRTRERADTRRFATAQHKQLVFYSEGSGFYKYFGDIIDYLLDNSDIIIHYVTSDFNDRIFENSNQQIQSYYIGPTKLISFFMKIDADMVIMTTPDLETYHLKRSLVRKDIEYVYLDHGMTSLHLMLREGALDNFDTIFCYGPNHVEEVRQTEAEYDLPEKRLVRTGYGLLDNLLKSVSAQDDLANQPPIALIAPSWQKDNLMELCLEQTVQPLLAKGFKVIVRPHPEFVKRFSHKLQTIIKSFDADIYNNMLVFETDFSSNKTVFTADLVVTDWSSIAQEYSYATKKPSIFVNTPPKVMNPNYQRIAAVPLDISMRDQIGESLDIDQLDRIGDVAERFMEDREFYRQKITAALEQNIYHIGSAAQCAGEYIVAAIQEINQNDLLTINPDQQPAVSAEVIVGA